jgi:hypothetical protein
VATLGVVEVRRGPGMGARALARDLACSQGSGEAELVPEGVRRGGARTRGVGRGGARARGMGRTRNLLGWAGPGCNYAHNCFRRAEADVF